MTSMNYKSWFETTRPKTLPLAAASIIMGSALAAWSQHFNKHIALLCLLTTLFLQILSNFANDYGDYQKGADTQERIGPLRGIQKGEITAKQLKLGMVIMVVLSLITGSSVIALAYTKPADIWIFLSLGILAIVAAITYTVGKKPYGYLGLGDLSVLIFFGLLGVCGTYYLQTHQLSTEIFLPALSTGFFACAVLNLNNLRDLEQDKKASKNTLIVKIGSKNGCIYHALLLILASGLNLIFAIIYFTHWYCYFFLILYPFLYQHLRMVWRYKEGEALRPMLGQMSLLALAVNLFFSLGLILS